MVNKCTGNKQGDGEGHGCFHTNFDISDNVSELCSNFARELTKLGMGNSEGYRGGVRAGSRLI